METNETKHEESNTTNSHTTETTTTPHVLTEDNNLLMGILCYLGPLVIIPYMTSKEIGFVNFHIRQGIVLFVTEIIIYIVASMMYIGMLYPIIMLLNLATLILTIMGIINVLQKKEASLPVLGQFAGKIKL